MSLLFCLFSSNTLHLSGFSPLHMLKDKDWLHYMGQVKGMQP